MMDINKSILEVIRSNYEHMFLAEKKVADIILQNPEKAVLMNVSELAELSGASDATVIRMCKHIGCKGFYQMKIKLSHELGENKTARLNDGQENFECAYDIFKVMVSNLLNMSVQLDMDTVKNCVNLIKSSDNIHIIATGNTIPIAMDMSFRLGKFGIKANSSVIPEYILRNIGLATKQDLVIGISHSGSSKNVLQAFNLAKERGIKTIGISNSKRSPIAHLADYNLCTAVINPIFSDNGPVSHVYEMAIVDVILYFVSSSNEGGDDIDPVELMLSEYKL